MSSSTLKLPKCKKKEKVFIFGTGSGGYYFYNVIKNQKNVIGFLDNNNLKHGTIFCGKSIFNPSVISSLDFDKIIIASDYYREIFQQLTEELGIPKQRISLYKIDGKTKKGLFTAIQDKFTSLLLKNICSDSILKSKITYSITSFFSSTMKLNQVNDLIWLDKFDRYKLITFLEERDCFSYSPRYIGTEQTKQPIITPSISAYRFENATISPINSAITLDKNITILTRIPSMIDGSADYSGGNIIAHGSRKVLLRKFNTEKIQHGIAITGSSDTNYYHWILEVLSKLQYIKQLPNHYSNYPIIISEKVQEIPSIKEFFNLFNMKNEIIYLKSIQQYRINELIYITPPNYLAPNMALGEKYQANHCYITKESILFLKKIALSQYKKTNNSLSPQRIFLARKPFIRSYNQDEVMSLLTKYGFVVIYLEELSFEKQVELMQHAEFIIGSTGAAWTNLIFVNSGIKALTWIAKESGDFAGYSSLAHHVDIQLDFITYTAGNQDSRGLYFSPYTIDCKMIEKWVIDNVIGLR